MSAPPPTRLTPEEYLALERTSEIKHEYYQGRMYAMAGGTHAHGLIVVNLASELRQCSRRRSCFVTTNYVRLRISQAGPYTYPDVIVIRGEPVFADGRNDTVLNPTLIVEVLSKSTEVPDRGFKFAEYRKLDSLQEYVLVSQTEARVEKFRRQSDGWVLSEAVGVDQGVYFESVECKIPMPEIYANVTFSPESSEQPPPRTS